MAVVGLDNKFVWANDAYCRLVGYPLADLKRRTWMDITVSEDVEGDLQSLAAVQAGKSSGYSLTKRYRHRLGNEVPVEIVVWRWPPMGHGNEVTGYVCEAIPQPVTEQIVEELHHRCRERCVQLIERINRLERQREKVKRTNDSQIVNVGNNSSDTIKIVAAVLIVLIGAVAYLSYVASWPSHQGGAQPPNVTHTHGE